MRKKSQLQYYHLSDISKFFRIKRDLLANCYLSDEEAFFLLDIIQNALKVEPLSKSKFWALRWKILKTLKEHSLPPFDKKNRFSWITNSPNQNFRK